MRGHVDTARENQPHGARDYGRRIGLGYEPADAERQQGANRRRIVLRGDDGNRHVRRAFAHLSHAIDALSSRHVEIEQQQIVGRHLAHYPQRFRVIRRLDEMDQGCERRKRAGERGAHQRMIVGDREAQFSNGYGRLHRTGGAHVVCTSRAL